MADRQGKSVPELLATIGGARELARWAAYLELYPPDEADWERAAVIAYCAANGTRFKKPPKLEQLKPAKPQRHSNRSQIELVRALTGTGKRNGPESRHRRR